MIYRVLCIEKLDIDKLAPYVSLERMERSRVYKHEIDRLRSVAVEYLLNETLKDFDSKIETPVTLSYDINGKPHLYLDREIFVSLTHSGKYVGCMVSDKPCGIDIEIHKNRDYGKIAKRICTESELSSIKNEEDFFDLWTAKESILKATGAGLSLDMRNFSINRGVEAEINPTGGSTSSGGNNPTGGSNSSEGSSSTGGSISPEGNNPVSFTTTVNGSTYIGATVYEVAGYSLSYSEEM